MSDKKNFAEWQKQAAKELRHDHKDGLDLPSKQTVEGIDI